MPRPSVKEIVVGGTCVEAGAGAAAWEDAVGSKRSAAGGIAGVARTIGAGLAPIFAGLLFSRPPLINAPFFIAGTLKIVYDLLLYRGFARSTLNSA